MRDDIRHLLMDEQRILTRMRGRYRQRKGYRRRWCAHMRTDAPPQRERMRERTGNWDGPTGRIGNFNPLVRFMLSRVGREWRTVRDELCHAIPRRSLLRQRVNEWCRPLGTLWYCNTVAGVEVFWPDEFGPHGSPGGWTCRWLFWVDGRTGCLRVRRPGDCRDEYRPGPDGG
jgi:hypothetical protein